MLAGGPSPESPSGSESHPQCQSRQRRLSGWIYFLLTLSIVGLLTVALLCVYAVASSFIRTLPLLVQPSVGCGLG